MYLQEIEPEKYFTTTLVKIKYDCCGKEHTMKWKDANLNFERNNQKHICRICFLRSNDNPAKKETAKAQAKKTNLEKYGTTMPINSIENIEKRREQFKDESYVNNVVEKRKATNKKKYGVEFAQQTEAVKQKQKETMMEKYGVEHPYQSPEIMEKMKQSNKEKYGVENVASLPEVRIKMAQTTLEKYGVEHYNQLPEMKEYLRENCKEWLSESYLTGGPNKGITRPTAWTQKQRETIADLVEKGEWAASYKTSLKGRYKSKKCTNADEPLFRSSYELKTHIWLDLNEDVLSYEYEPFAISYIGSDEHSRFYFPDFAIKLKTSNKIKILEIKNDYTVKSLINVAKDKALKLLCDEHQLDYEIWCNKEIESLKINLDDYQSCYDLFSK